MSQRSKRRKRQLVLRSSRMSDFDGRRRKARRVDVITSFPFVNHPTLFTISAFADGIHMGGLAFEKV